MKLLNQCNQQLDKKEKRDKELVGILKEKEARLKELEALIKAKEGELAGSGAGAGKEE